MSKVLLLDDSEDILFVLNELIHSMCGVECLQLSSYFQLEEYSTEVMNCGLAILDINLGEGEPSGLEAAQWLQGHRFGGQICFLTGHAQSHPLVKQARETGIEVFEKPIKTEVLVNLVSRAIEKNSPQALRTIC